MKRTLTILVSAFALLALTTVPSDAARRHKPAAAGGSGSLRVHVTGDSGRAVGKARVFVHRVGTRRHARGQTDRAGIYTHRGGGGSFTVAVNHRGYLRAATTVSVPAGASSTIDIHLMRRRVVLSNVHEVHHLGVLHHDLLKHAHHAAEAQPDGTKESFGTRKK
jgi:hypothetical protein